MRYILFIFLLPSLIYASQEDYKIMDKECSEKQTTNPLYTVTERPKTPGQPKVSIFKRKDSSDSEDGTNKKESSHHRQGGGWIESILGSWTKEDVREALIATKTLPLDRKF